MKYYKICPECSYFCNLKEKDEYCSLCGAKLITCCLNCEKEIDNPYARYCKSCGEKYPKQNTKPDGEREF